MKENGKKTIRKVLCSYAKRSKEKKELREMSNNKVKKSIASIVSEKKRRLH
jgi:hypothetical protein